MYAIPIDDTSAFAIRDEDDETWRCYYIDFDPLRVDSFKTPSGGIIYSATINPVTQAAWLIAKGQLFNVSRQFRDVVRVPLPRDDISVFDVTEINDRYYISCDSGRVWYFDLDTDDWVSVLMSEPPPERQPRGESETAADYVARTSPAMRAYVEKYPSFHKAIAVGDDIYFLAALGRVVRLRGDKIDELRLESGARLVKGGAEGNTAILCGDHPVAEIYRGTLDEGFERIFQNDERSLHMTALHRGVRYIGAATYPGFAGPSLFTWDGEDLTPVPTGCAREADNLLKLVSTGSVLWAIDEEGFFRLTSDGWALTELEDIANAAG